MFKYILFSIYIIELKLFCQGGKKIYHDDFTHMMDIGVEGWIFMIICAIAVILLIIVFVYLYNHYSTFSKSNNRLKNNIANNDTENPYISETKTKANFCPNCGKKLIDQDVIFCPYCGERI
ncbi:MAG: zinc ribbon domain-containing protein [Promethearchaeota archaeon]